MKWKATILTVIISITSIMACATWVLPRELSLYYQIQGGRLLNQVESSQYLSTPSSFACNLPVVNDPTNHRRLTLAKSALQKAVHYDPSASQGYLLLGRVECLLGEPINAIQMYHNYVRLRPENPLGHIELGFAYAILCYSRIETPSEEPKSIQCGKDIRANVLSEMYAANIDPKQILASADNEYTQQRWSQALNLYLLNDKFGQRVSSEAKFREEIAAIASNPSQIPQSEPPALLTTHILTDSLQIKAINLQWIYDASTLRLHPGGDPTIGVLWWNGDALTGVKVLDSREYDLAVRAQNTPPAPVRFQIVVDFQPAATFELSRGDMTWQEFYTSVHLDAGFHVIGIRFLNDDIINGLDRNLYIDWLYLHKKSE